MGIAAERVLHVEGVHVHFEECKIANLPLDVIDGRHGPTADIVRQTAPTHCGPIHDFYGGNERSGAVATNQLLQRLQTIERSRSAAAADNNAFGIRNDYVSFFVQLRWRLAAKTFQRFRDRRRIDSTDQNGPPDLCPADWKRNAGG